MLVKTSTKIGYIVPSKTVSVDTIIKILLKTRAETLLMSNKFRGLDVCGFLSKNINKPKDVIIKNINKIKDLLMSLQQKNEHLLKSQI